MSSKKLEACYRCWPNFNHYCPHCLKLPNNKGLFFSCSAKKDNTTVSWTYFPEDDKLIFKGWWFRPKKQPSPEHEIWGVALTSIAIYQMMGGQEGEAVKSGEGNE